MNRGERKKLLADIAELEADISLLNGGGLSEALDLLAMLSSLTARERNVLGLRFGIGDDPVKTLKEIGDQLGVGRGRVGEIEATAISKLRGASRKRRIKQLEEEAKKEGVKFKFIV